MPPKKYEHSPYLDRCQAVANRNKGRKSMKDGIGSGKEAVKFGHVWNQFFGKKLGVAEEICRKCRQPRYIVDGKKCRPTRKTI